MSIVQDIQVKRELSDGRLRAQLEEAYPYASEKHTIDGVLVEIFEPKSGVIPQNAEPVLIQLHGGGLAVQ